MSKTISNYFKPISAKVIEPIQLDAKENVQVIQVDLAQKKRKIDDLFVKDMTSEQKLDDLKSMRMAPDWEVAFGAETSKNYFKAIQSALRKDTIAGKVIYPIESEIYSFTQCPLDRIKVVILGQDPYHGPNQAHGLAFSVKHGIPPPPSLVNIYRELEKDIDGFKRPNHGNLESWLAQGVLLLNASLTVRKGEANSHSKIGWTTFTDAIIQYINKNSDHVVFLLWGGYAQKKGACINAKRHLVLKATHPSPLGANKGGWFGCKHFSKANEYLASNGKDPIDWTPL